MSEEYINEECDIEITSSHPQDWCGNRLHVYLGCGGFNLQDNMIDLFKYATIDKDGDLYIHKMKPKIDHERKMWRSPIMHWVDTVKFTGSWKKSLYTMFDVECPKIEVMGDSVNV